MSRETFTIESIEKRLIERGKREGEAFYRAKLSGIGFVTVFAHGDGDFLEENLGKQASAEIKVDNEEKGWKSASAFAKVENGAAPAPADKMSKKEWADRDLETAYRIAVVAHRRDMIEFYTAFPEGWTAAAIDSYEDLCVRARKYAVKDMEWIRNYALSEVPFG